MKSAIVWFKLGKLQGNFGLGWLQPLIGNKGLVRPLTQNIAQQYTGQDGKTYFCILMSLRADIFLQINYLINPKIIPKRKTPPCIAYQQSRFQPRGVHIGEYSPLSVYIKGRYMTHCVIVVSRA